MILSHHSKIIYFKINFNMGEKKFELNIIQNIFIFYLPNINLNK